MTEYITTGEAAKLLNTTPRQIRRYVAYGWLRTRRYGPWIKVASQDVLVVAKRSPGRPANKSA